MTRYNKTITLIRKILPCLVLISFAGVQSACPGPLISGLTDPDDSTQETEEYVLLTLLMNSRNTNEAAAPTFIDYNNSQVHVFYRYTRGAFTYSQAALVLKCLMGQLYRPAQNDCKGSGNAGNNYGANLYQYCDANNNSCNDVNGSGKLVTEGNSAAYDACAAETNGEAQWEVLGAKFLESLARASDAATYFPDLGTNAIWANQAASDTAARGISPGGAVSLKSKTDTSYVLCQVKR